MLGILLEDGEKNAVYFEHVAGQFAKRTNPTGIGGLGGHHYVVGEVEALVVGAEESSCWDFDFLGREGAGERNLYYFARNSV